MAAKAVAPRLSRSLLGPALRIHLFRSWRLVAEAKLSRVQS
jgi:hypothetical protein